MWIHFDNRAEAEAKLKSTGFRMIKNGAWVTDRIKASILRCHGDVVVVCYSEIDA